MKKKANYCQVGLDGAAGKKTVSGNPAEEILLQEAKESCKRDGFVCDGQDEKTTIMYDNEEMEIQGYKRSIVKMAAVWILITASFGILGLISYWFRRHYVLFTHSASSLANADVVVITEQYKEETKRHFIKKVGVLSSENGRKDETIRAAAAGKEDMVFGQLICQPEADGTFSDAEKIRYFDVKKRRYLWNPQAKCFVASRGLDLELPLSYYHSGRNGLDPLEQWKRRVLYGTNFIRVPVDSYWKLFGVEFFRPFYIFQIFSVGIWLTIEYYYFATAIVIMSAIGIAVSMHQTKQNQSRLRDTIQNVDFVEVLQSDGLLRRVGTESLVPGDIIVIPSSGCVMHCDAILLTGTAIVNESTLTGESVPLMKTPMPNSSDMCYLEKEHNRHTLYGGTRVIQARYFEEEKVLAFVIRTGYMTAKGNLVASILYPLPVDFQFEKDSYKFISILALVSLFGISFNFIRMLRMGETGLKVFGHTFDIVTITVPPALPAAMTVGSFYAANRLKKKNIICINPRTINVAGSLNLVCFDKTGTLTEDGMDFWGILPSLGGKFMCEMKKAKELLFLEVPDKSETMDAVAVRPPLLLEGMAACHSLTFIEGELCGDPLELKVYEATGWQYEELSQDEATNYDMMVSSVIKFSRVKNTAVILTEGGSDPFLQGEMTGDHVVGVVKNFPFSSSLQRSSVVTKVLSQPSFDFYCKGSPEMIKTLCLPETVPSNFSDCLAHYTRQGLRVIAMAHRVVTGSIVKIERKQRQDLEKDLTFLGFIVMENRLKSDTAEVLQVLANAGIRTVMITGDNIDTAVSVGRESGMICYHEKVIEVKSELNEGVETIRFVESVGMCDQICDKNSGKDYSTLQIDEESSRYHLAIDGRTLEIVRQTRPELLPRIYARGTIFARMKPDQKQMIVVGLQDLGYTVGMCGDGANDCGALKAAHAGISLTETEASVAAPFTSKSASIDCVPQLVRECRCALVTSFGIFKYMAGYSLVQFVSVMILYDIGTNLTDFQFLYIDLFLITLSSAVFGLTEAYSGPLYHKPPPTSLMAVEPVTSIITQLALTLVTIFISLEATRSQDWFKPYDEKYNLTEAGFLESPLNCHESYAVFTPTQFVYIFLALTFCKGYPYRKRFYTNVPFTVFILLAAGVSSYVAIYPADWVVVLMELEIPESFNFCLGILGLGFGHVIISILVESYLVRLIGKMCDRWGKKRKRFETLAEEMDMDSGWEPNRYVPAKKSAEVEMKQLSRY